MDGIKAAEVGVPKIEVSLKLAAETTLKASALYKNGKKTKALVFQAGLPLRRVSMPSEVPANY